MFEFEDSKLGRVKVVNITEARAAIASMMNDQEFNYVITKNNKPVRVVINYDTFRKTQSQLGQSAPAAKATSTAPAQTPSSLIRGLLENREKDIRTHANRSKPMAGEMPETVQRVVNGPDIFQEAPIEAPKPVILPEADYQLEETPRSENYFDALDASEEPAALAEPESIEYAAVDEPAAPAWEAESQPEAPFSPTEPVLEEAARDPEKEDYFNRYRKLYEPSSRYDQLYTEPAPKKAAEPVLERTPAFEPEPAMPFLEPDSVIEAAPVEAAPAPAQKNSAKDELVSLQDLLKELEAEKLSE